MIKDMMPIFFTVDKVANTTLNSHTKWKISNSK